MFDGLDVAQLFSMEMLPEEDATGYRVRLSLGIGQSAELIQPTALSAATIRPGWILPTGLSTITPQLGLNITPQEIYRKNTRGLLFERFVDAETRASLQHNHFVGAVQGLAAQLGINSHATRGRMAVCTECVKANLKGDGYAIWHRLWIMPGSKVCHIHKRPLFTYCSSCEAGHRRIRANWAPRIRCICGKSLQVVAKYRSKTEELLIGTATMASLAIQENFNMDLSGATVINAIQQQYGVPRITNAHLHLRLEEAFNDIAGDEAMELLGIKRKTLKRLVGMDRELGPIRHPFQVMAAIHVAFGGLPEFGVASSSEKDKNEYAVQPNKLELQQGKDRRSGCRALKGHVYAAMFRDLPFCEQKRITREARKWLRGLMATNPHINRTMARKTKGSHKRKFHLRHLYFVDMEWFDRTLPAVPNSVRQRPSLQNIPQIVAHIKARYDEAIEMRPLERISKSWLINHLASESAPNFAFRSQEVKEAIAKYADDTPKRRLRMTHWICLEVQKRQPSHTYADFEKYAAKNDHDFTNRFQRARKWLDKFDKL